MMATDELNITILDSVNQPEFASAELTEDAVLASRVQDNEATAARWQTIIDNRLIEWGQSRDEFKVDGLVGPSNAAIRKALMLIKYMRERDWPLPTGVIADGEGGIVFENRHDPHYQRIEIDEQGMMLLVTFHDCKMQGRPVPIDIE